MPDLARIGGVTGWQRAAAIVDGEAVVPERPGNGLAWNVEAVKRYRMA